jgi:mono/diheme cytochrome c family protein
MKRIALTLSFLAVSSAALVAQGDAPTTIPEMWNAWCARCHARDGTGRVDQPTVTVEPMDFTDCKTTTAEGDPDWELAISKGGPGVGLSSQMPAFGDALSPDQVREFVRFVKSFCREPGWPDGNLNLPRAIYTEKAFPEDEFVLAPVASHVSGEPTAWRFGAIYERRFGKRGQLEVVLPLASVYGSDSRASGLGDLELGWKQVLNPSASNHLIAAGMDFHFPTGDEARGLGEGTVVFEPYLASATTVGTQTYLQAQLKLEFPKTRPWRDHATIYNVYLGHDVALVPTTFTFGVELNGENEEVAITPQVRKGLSRTGALAAAFGVTLPVTERKEQGVKWVGFLLWEYLEPVFSRP